MSSKTFDPSKITVEDLFRAKKEWRQRQSNLPFEEKIKIVKKLQTVVRTIRGSNRRTLGHRGHSPDIKTPATDARSSEN